MALHEGQKNNIESPLSPARKAGKASIAALAAYTAIIGALASVLKACATKDDSRGTPTAGPTPTPPNPESPDFVDPNKTHTIFARAYPTSATTFTVEVKLNKGGASDGFVVVVESTALTDSADALKGTKTFTRSSDIKGAFPSSQFFTEIRNDAPGGPNVKIIVTDKKSGSQVVSAGVPLKPDGNGVGVGFDSQQKVQ